MAGTEEKAGLDPVQVYVAWLWGALIAWFIVTTGGRKRRG